MRIVVAAILVGLFIWPSVHEALAHGDADWIRPHQNPAGEWCCGEGDCVMLPKDSVAVTSRGYLVKQTGEVVPRREAMPSPDGAFWRCKRPDGSRRCFFAPPPAW